MYLNYNPLQTNKDLDTLLDRIENAQYVLLGEASHGTSEFYKWRIEISKKLIQEKGFSFIAVEGDWPDCFRVNKYIKGISNSVKNGYEVLKSFNRWPTWMWANKEMVELVEWLKEYNDTLINQQRQSEAVDKPPLVGFYGLDLYSLWESMEAIIDYLKKVDPSALKEAIEAYNCFEPYNKNVEEYARATAFVPQNCEDEIIQLLILMQSKRDIYSKDHGKNIEEEYFDVEQNAITAKDAEQYYRTMINGDVNSWNLRDTHMMSTLERLMDFYQKENNKKRIPKAIVWAHNTHIGDARFTDMKRSGMINLGQLVRAKKGQKNTVLIGFSTYNGTVIAAREWGANMEIMKLPSAIEGSWDSILHNIEYMQHDKKQTDKIIVFDQRLENTVMGMEDMQDDTSDKEYGKNRGQRAIGVVYNPVYERYGNYVPTILSSRYDALIFIDNTNALFPLYIKSSEDRDLPETFPTGV
ncbi:MAG: erythromycin esterase family protein [Candidatus Nitrosocosmicus sp.]|nr:erythromycin esterase family protein [Candidatus Nitrosocosmicus sp.]